jgi:hypothetical protein
LQVAINAKAAGSIVESRGTTPPHSELDLNGLSNLQTRSSNGC